MRKLWEISSDIETSSSFSLIFIMSSEYSGLYIRGHLRNITCGTAPFYHRRMLTGSIARWKVLSRRSLGDDSVEKR